MTIEANAKINWALNILHMRPDGYHEMDMLMQSISLCDTLELGESDALHLEGGTDDDLILRAARALNAHAGTNYGANMRLVKRIPAKAGLGGGSADCAATLLGLNQLWKLYLPMPELILIGSLLGADVPFCLTGGAARAQGMGEKLTEVASNKSISLVIVHPGGGLSTPAMFRAWDAEAEHSEPADIEGCIAALSNGDLAAMKHASRNMLTACAVQALPEIEEAIWRMYELGAGFAGMTGSGSAVFGAFETIEIARNAKSVMGDAAIQCETCRQLRGT